MKLSRASNSVLWTEPLQNQSIKVNSGPDSVGSAEMLVDFSGREEDGEADEEELLLLLQPHQLHPHLPLRILVLHQEVLAAVVPGLHPLGHGDVDGRTDAPEVLLKLVQQGQSHEAAVLTPRDTIRERQRAQRSRPQPAAAK